MNLENLEDDAFAAKSFAEVTPNPASDNGINRKENLNQLYNVTLNEDILGFRVTLHPEPKRRSEYFVKFSPISGMNPVQPSDPAPSDAAGPSHDGLPSNPIEIHAIPVTTTNSAVTLDANLLEAVFRIMADSMTTDSARYNRLRRRGVGQRSRNVSTRRQGTRIRRRTGRPRRRRNSNSDSEASMYEVVDVDYEKISSIKSTPETDWRLIPRYDLTKREAARQEEELFFLMTSESKHEAVEKPKVGEPACCVCHENAATRVVIPCGHRCLCQPCALHIATNRSIMGGSILPKRCPICQAAIGLMSRLR